MSPVHDTITGALKAHNWYFVGNLGVPGMPDSKDYKCSCGWTAGGGVGVGEDPYGHVASAVLAALEAHGFVVRKQVEPDPDTFSFREVRISLTAFAMWLLAGEPSEGREVELVDRFIQETT